MSGPNPLGISEQRVDPTFVGQPVPGPFPFGTIGSVGPTRGIGPRPKVPTLTRVFRERGCCYLKAGFLHGKKGIKINKNEEDLKFWSQHASML